MLTAMSRRSFGGGVEPLLLLFLALCAISAVRSQDTHPDEVGALRAVKSRLRDPYKRLRNWKHGDPCNSNWTGVVCVNWTLADGYQHIEQLELLKMNLSGTLAPELGNLSYLTILYASQPNTLVVAVSLFGAGFMLHIMRDRIWDFMWNNMKGSIPKEVGNLQNLKLLLLNGNQLTGSLPEELGYLPQLDRIQIDQNKISGPLPKSFANLNNIKHFHMNNNSIGGDIPRELSRLPNLVHFLLDDDDLTGSLPAEFSELPNLLILQLDNNNFHGTEIPASFANMTNLTKLSLRNCNLQGPIPDLSKLAHLGYIDISFNQLSGPVPSDEISANITTIKLSNNGLNGTIPENYARLSNLQELSLDNNLLSGAVPSAIWQSRTTSEKLTLDFRNNKLTEISGSSRVPPNVTLLLQGNPILCANTSINRLYCGSSTRNNTESMENGTLECSRASCSRPREFAPEAPGVHCYCAVPFIVEYRLKSPGFMDFDPYKIDFERYLTHGLGLSSYQLIINQPGWQEGKRLKMELWLFPHYDEANQTDVFNVSELKRIRSMFTRWKIPDNSTFGPYELLGFNLLDPYKGELLPPSASDGLSKGALAGITLGSAAAAIILTAAVSILIIEMHLKKIRRTQKNLKLPRIHIKIDGVRSFTYEEMSLATSQFSTSAQIGQGGYGKVYKGVLADGLTVAIKRAQEGSLQGEKEFCTEIELLSRLHHRHLVSLIGYCDEEGEQMLVYEFMPNGTLREHLSTGARQALTFAARLRIALGSARGILYLHADADPPVIHRDIKASNILLDSRFTAKVADFGLSRLAPIADLDGIVPAHVSTVVKGTPGYLDPEYFLTHKLTDKSDVYSFGVVLLELLTGMHPISHGKNLFREVNLAYQAGDLFAIVDQRMGVYPPRSAEALVSLALKCCNDETDNRPTLAQIVRELETLLQMVPDSDPELTSGSSLGDGARGPTTLSPSSIVTTKDPFVSYDNSDNYLDSRTFPFIPPR